MRIRFVMDRFPSRVSGRVNVALIFFEMYVKISVLQCDYEVVKFVLCDFDGF